MWNWNFSFEKALLFIAHARKKATLESYLRLKVVLLFVRLHFCVCGDYGSILL